MASSQVSNIFENSDFVLLLNQKGEDRKILAERLNISNDQLAHVTNVNAGEGLISYGGTMIPFRDKFPTDGNLYKIMTTKLDETEGQDEKTERCESEK